MKREDEEQAKSTDSAASTDTAATTDSATAYEELAKPTELKTEELAQETGGSWSSFIHGASNFFHGDDDGAIGSALSNFGNDFAIAAAGDVGTPTGTQAEQEAGSILGTLLHAASESDL